MKFPETLEKENLTATKPVIYAQGSVAMLSAKPLDFSKGIALLANKDIEKIAIANPKLLLMEQLLLKHLKCKYFR